MPNLSCFRDGSVQRKNARNSLSESPPHPHRLPKPRLGKGLGGGARQFAVLLHLAEHCPRVMPDLLGDRRQRLAFCAAAEFDRGADDPADIGDEIRYHHYAPVVQCGLCLCRHRNIGALHDQTGSYISGIRAVDNVGSGGGDQDVTIRLHYCVFVQPNGSGIVGDRPAAGGCSHSDRRSAGASGATTRGVCGPAARSVAPRPRTVAGPRSPRTVPRPRGRVPAHRAGLRRCRVRSPVPIGRSPATVYPRLELPCVTSGAVGRFAGSAGRSARRITAREVVGDVEPTSVRADRLG